MKFRKKMESSIYGILAIILFVIIIIIYAYFYEFNDLIEMDYDEHEFNYNSEKLSVYNNQGILIYGPLPNAEYFNLNISDEKNILFSNSTHNLKVNQTNFAYFITANKIMYDLLIDTFTENGNLLLVKYEIIPIYLGKNEIAENAEQIFNINLYTYNKGNKHDKITIRKYAAALDKYEKNINKYVYPNKTLSFSGIGPEIKSLQVFCEKILPRKDYIAMPSFTINKTENFYGITADVKLNEDEYAVVIYKEHDIFNLITLETNTKITHFYNYYPKKLCKLKSIEIDTSFKITEEFYFGCSCVDSCKTIYPLHVYIFKK